MVQVGLIEADVKIGRGIWHCLHLSEIPYLEIYLTNLIQIQFILTFLCYYAKRGEIGIQLAVLPI